MRMSAAHCGDIEVDVRILEGPDEPAGMRLVPSMCFVIEHGEEIVVWDTSMHPHVCEDAVGYWGPVAELFSIPRFALDETLVARLALLSIEPGDVTHVVNSHLHNDHCGMNRFFPNATVLARQRELDHAVGVMDDPMSGYVRNDFCGDQQRLEVVDYEEVYDLLGDGRLQLVSTIGHTPGHQSLLVTFASGRRFALSGDAVYNQAQLDERRPPGLVADGALATASVAKLADMAGDGVSILIPHDPATWGAAPAVATIWEEL
ncbi:MAG: N-acyl homoserine lactonase family protein [Acidimicrobiales bacterium]